MNIAVLLTVYNRREKTIECLNRLFCQILPNDSSFDVFLTDDGSTDGTSEAVRKFFPSVKIIKGNGYLFWNRGMWTAWEEASKFKIYDYYLWLNDDTYIYEDCIENLISNSISVGGESIIVGAVQWKDHTKGISYGARYDRKHLKAPDGVLRESYSFNGNIVLIPHSVFKVVGNLDYRFRHSRGDIDYGLRARKAGFKIFQSAKYLGECDRHESMSKWCNPEFSLYKRWRALKHPTQYNPQEAFYFDKKHYGISKAIFHQFTLYIRLLFPTIWIKLFNAKA